MLQNDVVKKISSMKWNLWMDRPFPILVPYLMITHGSRKAFESQGIEGEFPIILWDRGGWCSNSEILKLAEMEAENYLKKIDIFKLSKQCENLYNKAKIEIVKMENFNSENPLDQYRKVIELISPINVYVWVAHGAEEYYRELVKKMMPSYNNAEIEKFIGDISYPLKKNAHNLMEEDIKNGLETEILLKKYSWMKARRQAGFGEGYTFKEIEKIKNDLIIVNENKVDIEIPTGFELVVAQIRELVYLRTFRTDALMELYFLARPIFFRVEKLLNITEIENYLPEDILSGNLKKWNRNFALLKYYEEVIVSAEPVISLENNVEEKVKGSIAWTGKVTGTVKIVFNPSEANKVETGDVMVTNMTIPAYLQAMKKASAFITDEGGITCHAAIIAREMKKPCIIGTKFATKVFKDGDMVEVDAENGIVKKI